MLHGFCGTSKDNFIRTGWVDALTKAGRQTLLMDFRGHGHSQKIYDPAAYHREVLAGDAVNLLDHLGLDRVDLVGFSMGAVVSLHFAVAAQDRLNTLALMGLGDRFFTARPSGPPHWDAAEALEATGDLSGFSPRALALRAYAERLGQDLGAIAACARASKSPPDLAAVKDIAVPFMILAGERDVVAGGLSRLEAELPRARCVTVPGVTHDRTFFHPLCKAAVIDFLAD